MGNINEKNYDNLSEAVAFVIAFVPMIYTYDDYAPIEYENVLCTRCGDHEQSMDFRAPKANIKKSYGILDMLEYGVNEEFRNELIQRFDISEKDFRPVRNKIDDIVFYQITPQHTMLPISSVNRVKALKPCRKCGSVQHRINKYKNEKGNEYYYITKEALDDLHDLNKTSERFDMFFPLYIVSRRVYEYMTEKEPRMRFFPMFLKG